MLTELEAVRAKYARRSYDNDVMTMARAARTKNGGKPLTEEDFGGIKVVAGIVQFERSGEGAELRADLRAIAYLPKADE